MKLFKKFILTSVIITLLINYMICYSYAAQQKDKVELNYDTVFCGNRIVDTDIVKINNKIYIKLNIFLSKVFNYSIHFDFNKEKYMIKKINTREYIPDNNNDFFIPKVVNGKVIKNRKNIETFYESVKWNKRLIYIKDNKNKEVRLDVQMINVKGVDFIELLPTTVKLGGKFVKCDTKKRIYFIENDFVRKK